MGRLVGVLVLFVACLFGALLTGVAVYYYVSYALGLLLVGGFLWCAWNLTGVGGRVRRRTYRAQVGGYLEAHLDLWNRTPLPKGWLVVRELGNLPEHAVLHVVQPEARANYSWQARTFCRRRGLFTVGPLQIESWDPMGLFHLRRRLSGTSTVIVYPRTVPLPHLRIPLSQLPGEEAFRRHTHHLTPLASSVRDYKHGDSVSRIHWPTTARTGRLMVKEFDQGLSTTLWILLDLEGRAQVGKDEESSDELGVTIAGSVAQRYLSLDVPVGLSLHGERHYLITPDASPTHLQHILEALAVAQAKGTVSLADAISQMATHLGRYTTLLVITPSSQSGWPAALAHLQRRGLSAMAVLIDPQSYGVRRDVAPTLERLSALGIPALVARRGEPLEETLVSPHLGTPTSPYARAEVAWR